MPTLSDDPRGLAPLRVLLVDDDEALVRIHALVLRQHGYEVETAADGTTALLAARRARFDLVVSDIQMRRMDGLELVATLRGDGLDVPVVLMTGHPDVETAIQAIDLGVVRYLPKPVDGPRLLHAVGEGLRAHILDRIRRLDVDNEGLRVLVDELRRARDAALAGLRSRSEFLARVSRELHAPSSTVVALTGLLAASEPVAERREQLLLAQAAADHLTRTIADLIDLADLAGGRTQLAATAFDLRAVLAAHVARHRAVAKPKDVPITLDIDADVPGSLVGDGERIGHVLDLLLDNAVKFTDRGRIAVRVHVLTEDAARVRLRVVIADTGVGIPPASLGRVSEPFIQAGDRTREGGLGLGLAIATELASSMRGGLAIESAVGAGTTVRLTVELARPATPSPRAGG